MTNATVERRAVSANEAARIKGCSVTAIITGTTSGALKHERGPGGKYGTLLISRASLEAWEPNGVGRPRGGGAPAGTPRKRRPRAPRRGRHAPARAREG